MSSLGIQKMEHVGIFVDDLAASVHFYVEGIGMEVKNTVTLNGQEKLVFLGFPDSRETLIELVGGNHEGLGETGRVHHLAFTVDDIEAQVHRLTSLGVSFMDETPNALPDGTKYIFFFGPSREHLELFQPPTSSLRDS